MLSVIMIIVVKLNVVMLSVVAPLFRLVGLNHSSLFVRSMSDKGGKSFPPPPPPRIPSADDDDVAGSNDGAAVVLPTEDQRGRPSELENVL